MFDMDTLVNERLESAETRRGRPRYSAGRYRRSRRHRSQSPVCLTPRSRGITESRRLSENMSAQTPTASILSSKGDVFIQQENNTDLQTKSTKTERIQLPTNVTTRHSSNDSLNSQRDN
mmetsp:Transcript_12723/g.22885  ORF Transcript_12723/g.22885 Transcript_12723/m.22885 type:complete len:119 (-) Transcript_12723:62-418(-)